MKQEIENILDKLGVDTKDDNFVDTPKRVEKALKEILKYQNDEERQLYLQEILQTSFPTTYHGIVAQKNIQTISMCPHHMQPIEYCVDIGYVAKDKAIGLSKLTRIATTLSARMVLQESYTDEIADVLFKGLNTEGVIVIVRGKHGCMVNRGVKQNVITTTSSIRGIFEHDTALRQEFLTLNN